jgi:hypothetical protein
MLVESAIVARASRDEPGAAPSISIDSERYPLEEPPSEVWGAAQPQETAIGLAEASAAAPESEPQPSRLREYAPVLTGAVIVGAYVALCYLANALFSALP